VTSTLRLLLEIGLAVAALAVGALAGLAWALLSRGNR
jgi:hypothetical protein